MPLEERRTRSERLTAQVRENNIHKWFARQMADAQSDISSKANSANVPPDA
jgi:trehalose-6-phosphate synthase